MKTILRNYGVGMTSVERQTARFQAQDATIARGTGRTPQPVRDVFAQPAPRGVLLNWRSPSGFNGDVAGYRIYKDTETNLFAEIRDPNTRQHFIDSSAGSTPPVANFYVAAINKLGVQGPITQVQSSALTEAGAPQLPGSPGDYGQGFGGGGGFSRGEVNPN